MTTFCPYCGGEEIIRFEDGETVVIPHLCDRPTSEPQGVLIEEFQISEGGPIRTIECCVDSSPEHDSAQQIQQNNDQK